MPVFHPFRSETSNMKTKSFQIAGQVIRRGSPSTVHERCGCPRPAGLSCATIAASRGHKVTLYEATGDIGGEFAMAARVPGKV